MERIIEVNNLSYTYDDGTEALEDVSFSVQPNSRVAVMGPNGAGKSTLLFHLNALYLAQKGEIRVKSRRVCEENKEWVRQNVGLVMQDPDDQVFSASVFEDVAFGLVNFGWQDRAEIEHRVKWALESLNIYDLKDRPPHHLSYGQKKRAALAGVLAVDPGIIIFDEPLAHLDPGGQSNLKDILRDLQAEGKTLITVTHDVDFACSWADRIILLKNGSLVGEGGREILADSSLLARVNFSPPAVIRLLENMESVNLPEAAELPLTPEETADYLDGLME